LKAHHFAEVSLTYAIEFLERLREARKNKREHKENGR
jgi:hypothetical protein